MFTDASIKKFFAVQKPINSERLDAMHGRNHSEKSLRSWKMPNGMDEREIKLKRQAEWREELRKQVEEKKYRMENEKREKQKREKFEEEKFNREIAQEKENINSQRKDNLHKSQESTVKHEENSQKIDKDSNDTPHHEKPNSNKKTLLPKNLPNEPIPVETPLKSNQRQKSYFFMPYASNDLYQKQSSLQNLINQLKSEAVKAEEHSVHQDIEKYKEKFKSKYIANIKNPPKISLARFEKEPVVPTQRMKHLKGESVFLPLKNTAKMIMENNTSKIKSEDYSVSDPSVKEQLDKLDEILEKANFNLF